MGKITKPLLLLVLVENIFIIAENTNYIEHRDAPQGILEFILKFKESQTTVSIPFNFISKLG